MAKEVKMPQMGYDMTEGRIAQWLKKPGDEVKKGDALAEIETDKVTIEIEAFDEGVLLQLVAAEGETVPVGQTIAFIGTPSEKVGDA